MKMLIKEYLASLKERAELDVLLPDLLSEMGFRVFSRPSIGTRQMGVDVAAVGEDIDHIRKVFLFSIKAGNLGRNDWDGDATQSLRPSLNEIKDTYIPNRLPPQYEKLPIVICITLGGDIKEAVAENLRAFTRSNSTDRISYQEWDGDHLAQLILSGILRENLLPEMSRGLFRKSIALLDEPDVSYAYFKQLVDDLLQFDITDRKNKLSLLRQINLMLWILLVWAKDSDNFMSPILCGEYAILRVWPLIALELENPKRSQRHFADVFTNLIEIQFAAVDALINGKVYPTISVEHGLTSIIPSREYIDKNLKLFEVVGLIAQRGLWQIHMHNSITDKEAQSLSDATIRKIANALIEIFNNNPILASPIRDDHAIELEIVFHFLRAVGRTDAISGMVAVIFSRCAFAYKANLAYPCIFTDYWDLTRHPKTEDGYRESVTKASVLIPTLAVWAALVGNKDLLSEIALFVEKDYAHSTLQLWFPDQLSEPLLYTNLESHGLAMTDIKISSDPSKMLLHVRREFDKTEHFEKLSAVKFGILPLLTLAARHYRIPVCPQLIHPE